MFELVFQATILQNTAEYIFQLESEKLKLLQQNERLKQVLHQCKCGSAIQKAALIEATEKVGLLLVIIYIAIQV